MHFLPDVYVPCEQCHGKRYNKETLDIRFKGKTIADVLDMPVEEAVVFFEHIPKIRRRLETLNAVGLGYIRLGQPATTLSGGEAQRVKLATELSKVATGSTLYILDEPTTGLHFADVERLLDVLQRLVDQGNSVVVIEHNLDVIKTADRIIDMGPEGGEDGGEVIASGTPEEVAGTPGSYTGEFLQALVEPAAPKARRGTGKRKRRVAATAGMSATYRESPPPGAARVARVLRVDATPPGAGDHVERVLPDGCADVVWIDGEGIVVAGPATREVLVEIPAGAAALGVRFGPGAAGAALGVAAHELRDSTVALEDVWGAPADGAGRAPGGARRPRAASRCWPPPSRGASTAPARPDSLVTRASALLARGMPVTATSREVALTDRHLRRRFHDAVGYGPKTLQRVLRLRRFLALAESGRRARTWPASRPRPATPTSRTSRGSARSWRACRRRRCWHRAAAA